MKKQTARNNNFLRNVKKMWNSVIFKEASRLVNTEGEDIARSFVQQYTIRPLEY